MKANSLIYGSLAFALMGASACKNSDISFPDYEGGTTVYFAYQNPVRTIVLGEDVYNTDADNAHRCAIYSTSGGTYDGISATVSFDVDESLVEDHYFDEAKTKPILAMPTNYYHLESSELQYSGSQTAHVDVQLTDEFFADPNSVENTYVIPLKMTSIKNGADRINEEKSYVMYCVKFINKYQAIYLRRGVDVVTDGETTFTNVRHKGVENDEVFQTKSTSLNTLTFTIPVLNVQGKEMYDINNKPITCDIELTFNESGECTIASKTEGITVSGSGHYGEKTEKLAWGNKDRDGLYLEYTLQAGDYTKMAVKDTLVFQTRGVSRELFNVY